MTTEIVLPIGMLASEDLEASAALRAEAQALLVKHGCQLQSDHTRRCERRGGAAAC